MERDPRIDPKPGDVLAGPDLLRRDVMTTKTITRVPGTGFLFYKWSHAGGITGIMSGDSCANESAFREWARTAEVLHAVYSGYHANKQRNRARGRKR